MILLCSLQQEMNESLYQIPPDDGNDYEDIPGITELEKRTVSNTQSNSLPRGNTGPPVLTGPPAEPPAPRMAGSDVALDENTPSDAELKYSKVNKSQLRKKEDLDCSSPVINGHYTTSRDSSLALAQEIDRLANDLENSRAIARQW